MDGRQVCRFNSLLKWFVSFYVKKGNSLDFTNYKDIKVFQLQEWTTDRYMLFLQYKNTYYRVYELMDFTVEVDICSIPLNFYGYDLSQGFLQEAKIDNQSKQEVI